MCPSRKEQRVRLSAAARVSPPLPFSPRPPRLHRHRHPPRPPHPKAPKSAQLPPTHGRGRVPGNPTLPSSTSIGSPHKSSRAFSTNLPTASSSFLTPLHQTSLPSPLIDWSTQHSFSWRFSLPFLRNIYSRLFLSFPLRFSPSLSQSRRQNSGCPSRLCSPSPVSCGAHHPHILSPLLPLPLPRRLRPLSSTLTPLALPSPSDPLLLAPTVCNGCREATTSLSSSLKLPGPSVPSTTHPPPPLTTIPWRRRGDPPLLSSSPATSAATRRA